MVVESEIPKFLDWLPPALLVWLVAVASLALAGVLIGGLVCVLEYGPGAGLRRLGRILWEIPVDLVRISPRRVWALTWLAVKDSLRRRVVVGFAVFILLLMFAGWFLDPDSSEPARLYLNFVLDATGYLVLLLALFLSALSLPGDIQNKTLHTVVTKPVRASEVVLGRVLGFTLIGTGLLVVMGLLSYGFVVSGLSHTHTLVEADLREVGPPDKQGRRAKTGYTSRVYAHQHRVHVEPDVKTGLVEAERNHTHELEAVRSEGGTAYRLGRPQGMLQARVPVYGKLAFRDADGLDTEKGINVGDEWTYRSYVQGQSDAAAMWTFEGIREEDFPRGLPVEFTLGVFRTHKGDIEKGVAGSLSLRNPKTGLLVELEIFESKEFSLNKQFVPRKIKRFASAEMVSRRQKTPEGTKYSPPPAEIDDSLDDKDEFDLYEDLVADGRVEIWLQCLDSAQYFGAAQPDLYLRASDASFALNFAKGYLGIWLQMVLVIGFGVMFSTFLSAPVAILATAGSLLGGFFVRFMAELASPGTVIGGGPSESLVRLLRQDNMIQELNPGLGTEVVQMFDTVAGVALWVISYVLPPFGDFNTANYVSNGFDISPDLAMVHFAKAMAFLLPVFVAGYIFLKTREVAR
jgi:ABC-type transport system involved in multi-copper enzyme maturation permease subunit